MIKKKKAKIGAKVALILSILVIFVLPIILIAFCYIRFLKYGNEKTITVYGAGREVKVLGTGTEEERIGREVIQTKESFDKIMEKYQKVKIGAEAIRSEEENFQENSDWPDRVIVEKIGIKAPIVWSEGKSEEEFQVDMRKGVIHYPGTAKPGQLGNIFITGHSTYYKSDPGKFKNVFIRLGELKIGDQVDVITDGKNHFEYEIFQIEPVWPDDQRIFDFDNKSEKILTLATCWPIGSYEKRLMIKARQTN